MQHSKNFNEIASDKRWVSMMGVMKGVRQEIAQLAPHPNRQDQKGPSSVKDDVRGANNDRDATFGSLMIEAALGAPLGAALGETLDLPDFIQDMHWGRAVDLYDEARYDWNNTDAKNDNSKGSYSDQFNVTSRPKNFKSAEDKAWERYLNDLPNRRVLEQSFSSLSREMDRIEKDNMMKMKKLAFSM